MAARQGRPGQARLKGGPVLRWLRVDDGWLPDCVVCTQKLQEPFLIEAAASVGIEHDMDTGAVLRGLLAGYHRNRHTNF